MVSVETCSTCVQKKWASRDLIMLNSCKPFVKICFTFLFATNVANIFELVPPYKIYVPPCNFGLCGFFRCRTLWRFLVGISQRKVLVSTFSVLLSSNIHSEIWAVLGDIIVAQDYRPNSSVGTLCPREQFSQ